MGRSSAPAGRVGMALVWMATVVVSTLESRVVEGRHSHTRAAGPFSATSGVLGAQQAMQSVIITFKDGSTGSVGSGGAAAGTGAGAAAARGDGPGHGPAQVVTDAISFQRRVAQDMATAANATSVADLFRVDVTFALPGLNHILAVTAVPEVLGALTAEYSEAILHIEPNSKQRSHVMPSSKPLPSYILEQLAQGHVSGLVPSTRGLANGTCARASQQPRCGVTPWVNASCTAAQALDWAHDRIDQERLPRDGYYRSDQQYTGQGVVIYVLDTGIVPSHTEFRHRDGQPRSRVTDMVTLVTNGTSENDNGSPVDCSGHGTFLASVAAGVAVGMAPDAEIVSVKVADCRGENTNLDLMMGIVWAINDKAGPRANRTGHVINISRGGERSAAMDATVRVAVNNGLVVVAAAGNDSDDVSTVSPSGEPLAITVAASDSTDAFAFFSNRGPLVDIVAPGTDIYGADHRAASRYTRLDGTSLSAPLVSGAVARYLSAHGPGVPPAEVAQRLIEAGVRDVLSEVPSGTVNLLLQNRLTCECC